MATEQAASSAAWVKRLLDLFASQGVEASGLLRDAGIPAAAVEEPTGRFGLDEVNRLWQLAVAASGQPTLGLDRQLAGRFINFGIAAQTISAGASLWSGLESLSQYLALTNDAAAFTLERDHPDGWLCLTHGNDAAYPRQRLEYGLLTMVLVCQRVTGHAVRPLAVEFVFPEPADVHRHRMAFPCPLRFDRPVNRFLLGGGDLALPVAAGSPSAALLQERVLEALLAALGPARTSFRVAQEMVRRLHQGVPEAASIAAGIGMAEPAMVRQLRSERTSLEELLDRVRREMARESLGATQLPLSEMPSLVGLANEEEFAAACWRWFNSAPADYREQHGPELRPG